MGMILQQILEPFEAMSWIYVAMMAPWNGRFLRWCPGKRRFGGNFMLGCWHPHMLHMGLEYFHLQFQGCRFVPAIEFRKHSATDGTELDLNIGETRVWRLDSGPNLQPWIWFKFTTNVGGEGSVKVFVFSSIQGLLPRRLTWLWKIPIFNRKYLFKWWMIHCQWQKWQPLPSLKRTAS